MPRKKQEPALDTGDDTGAGDMVRSKSEALADSMGKLNFRPKSPRHPNYIEYFRVYNDAGGKTARTVAVVKKDVTGLEPEKPDYFTVTMQMHIPATLDAVNAKTTPVFAKPDMLRILAMFEDNDGRQVAWSETCSRCGKTVSEVLSLGGDTICLKCSDLDL